MVGIFINMKKIVRLTESDLIRLVNKVINEQSSTMTPDMLNSPKGQHTKKFKQVFNKLYKTNFPIDGNWMDKKYNETMAKYIKDKGLPVYVCKKNDDYCGNGSEGEVTVYEEENVGKLFDFLRADLSAGKDQPKNVKMFQDWLDRYFPTWLKGGKLNRGRGYGTFGPNTKASWTKYKSQYKEN
jgi:hypothetical protein